MTKRNQAVPMKMHSKVNSPRAQRAIRLCLWAALCLPLLVEAKPVAVTILMADGKRRIGFVADSNDRGLLFQATDEPGAPGEPIPFSGMRGVAFTEESDIMGQAQYAYSRLNYEDAARQFAEIAKEYENVAAIPRQLLGNFACEARYYHIDCLRRLGRYAEIPEAMKTRTGLALENGIPEVLLPSLKIFRLWGHLAVQDWDALAKGLAPYEKPLSAKEAEFLVGNPFTNNDPGELVQLYFMRAKMLQAKQQLPEALDDFFRAALLDYGADRGLAQQALEAIITIQAAQPEPADQEAKLTQLHAPAVVLQNVYRKGELPIRFQDFAQETETLKKRRLEGEAKAKFVAKAEAEELAKSKDAEAKRLAEKAGEDKKKAEEAKKKEEAKKAEDAKKRADEVKKAEEAKKKAEEARLKAEALIPESKKKDFKEKDRNGNEKLTIEEYFGEPKNKLAKRQLDEFAALDKNKDENLSLVEFAGQK